MHIQATKTMNPTSYVLHMNQRSCVRGWIPVFAWKCSKCMTKILKEKGRSDIKTEYMKLHGHDTIVSVLILPLL